MKKIFTLIVCAFMFLGLTGCGEEKSNKNKDKIDITTMSAEKICNYFKNTLPISKVIVYTEETDTNELLGRPGSYTSKVNFADRRAGQMDIDNDPVGGTFEVFENEEDATKRREYVESVASSGPLAQYHYQYENVYLRVDHALTPSMAKEYEDTLKSLQEGKKPIAVKYTPKTLKEKLIYNGYYDLTETVYMKVINKETDSNYFFSLDSKFFQIREGNASKTYYWDTGEDADGIKTTFEQELNDASLTVEEL